jgi:hypothetical protein
MAITPAASSCSPCPEGSAFRSSAWEKAAADPRTLLYRPNQFSVAGLVVPQEGFEAGLVWHEKLSLNMA